jgi:hypothetical protein
VDGALTCIAPIRPLQLCADGGYQPSLGVLGVPLIMVPDKYVTSACFNFTLMLFMLLFVYFQLFSQFICLSYLYDLYALCSHDPYRFGYI